MHRSVDLASILQIAQSLMQFADRCDTPFMKGDCFSSCYTAGGAGISDAEYSESGKLARQTAQHQLKTMKVSTILSSSPSSISPETPIVDAAHRMQEENVAMLPVCERNTLLGTITDRDITVRVTAFGYNPNLFNVRHVMSREMIYCFEDDEMDSVSQMMAEKNVRQLPVVDEAMNFLGVVSQEDIASQHQQDRLADKFLEVSERSCAVV